MRAVAIVFKTNLITGRVVYVLPRPKIYCMKYVFILIMLCMVITGCNHSVVPSTTPIVNAQIQNEKGATILAGHCSVSILQTNPYKEWFDRSYTNYVVDTTTVSLMKNKLANKTIEVFLGSWCGDSKREVPRLIKVLQAASFDTANLKLVFVDYGAKTYKQSPQHEEAGKVIHHVPTIIVYNHDNEMGRIIESPKISLEKDLLAIVLHRSYLPNYNSIAWWLYNVRERATPITDEKLASIAATIKPLCEGLRDFNGYGYVLLAQKNYAEALNVFKLNSIIFPTNASAYNSLGEAYLTTGDKENAKQSFEKVLELKHADENAIKRLGELK